MYMQQPSTAEPLQIYEWNFRKKNQIQNWQALTYLTLLLLLLLLLLLQVKPEITIYNYISHKEEDIRQRKKMMAEKGNF